MPRIRLGLFQSPAFADIRILGPGASGALGGGGQMYRNYMAKQPDDHCRLIIVTRQLHLELGRGALCRGCIRQRSRKNT